MLLKWIASGVMLGVLSVTAQAENVSVKEAPLPFDVPSAAPQIKKAPVVRSQKRITKKLRKAPIKNTRRKSVNPVQKKAPATQSTIKKRTSTKAPASKKKRR